MENFFGDPYMMWHDGIDPAAASALEGAERDQAENMLIESMQQGSYWAPMGLREMRSQKAVPVMKEMLPQVNGALLIEIAIALNTIEDTTEYNSYLLRVLREFPSPYTRLRAAMRLRDFPSPEVIEALFDAVSDVDYLVRYHAAESLLAILGLKHELSEYKELFRLIAFDSYNQSGRSSEDAIETYKKAEQMLRTLFETKSN